MSILHKLENCKDLTPLEQELMNYILKHKEQIVDLNISDLADITYTSNATIIRLCHKLGVTGYKDFKMQLLKDMERRIKENNDIDVNYPFHKKENSEIIMKNMADLTKEAVISCYNTISSQNLELAAKWIIEAKDIYIFAVGDSLISSMSFSNRLMKIRKHAIIGTEFGEIATHVNNIASTDIAIFISYSGSNVIHKKYFNIIRKSACKMILISSNNDFEGFNLVINFPNKESYDEKISTFYSQNCIQYILNCIYSMAFSLYNSK